MYIPCVMVNADGLLSNVAQALVDDVLQHKLNRVNIETTAQGEGKFRHKYS